MVIERPKRYRDKLQAHYTRSRPIVSFMVSRLAPSKEDKIWEPCAGAGDLIDGVLEISPFSRIRASEINDEAVSILKSKYNEFTNIDICHEDSVNVGAGTLFEKPVSFTRIISNPPYGAYQAPERRRQLKNRFPNLYVRETYGVMMYHALSLLHLDGRLVFIVPDTFLWLHRHEALRKTLISETTIEEIALFPSKFFPNVNFGYSGLCIITLIKHQPASDHKIRILSDFPNSNALFHCSSENQMEVWPCTNWNVLQTNIANKKHAELVNYDDKSRVLLSERAECTLASYAEVKTGFYSGNDRRWIRKLDGSVPRSKSYQEINRREIAPNKPTLKGFSGTKHFIPIVKGGAVAYSKPTHWYVDWSEETVTEYRKKGKNPARFQNSAYYFREGIGIPMVSSSRMTGALLKHRLFDQGIVGVFPHDSNLLFYILGFVNSKIATELLRRINPTANNSANYIKRLPFVVPTMEELLFVDPLVYDAIGQANNGAVESALQRELDSFYSQLWCRDTLSG